MPAKRLPWFRFWIDATSHGKVRQLDDATFRTWVELLDAAAKQPRRGRFDSRAEAVSIVRRPAKHLATLIKATLIDESPEGLVMHDWDEWQRWRGDDANDSGTSPERPLNDSRTSPDYRRNNCPNDSPTSTDEPSDEHTNDESLRVRAEGDADTEEELTPLPPMGAGRLRVQKGKKPSREPIADVDIDALVDKWAPRYGSGQAVRDEIDAALNHEARYKSLKERTYVDVWLRRESERRPSLRILAGHNGHATATTSRRMVDHTGCEAGCPSLHPEQFA